MLHLMQILFPIDQYIQDFVKTIAHNGSALPMILKIRGYGQESLFKFWRFFLRASLSCE